MRVTLAQLAVEVATPQPGVLGRHLQPIGRAVPPDSARGTDTIQIPVAGLYYAGTRGGAAVPPGQAVDRGKAGLPQRQREDSSRAGRAIIDRRAAELAVLRLEQPREGKASVRAARKAVEGGQRAACLRDFED